MSRLLVLGLLVLAAFWAFGRFLRSLGGPAGAPPAKPGASTVPVRGADLVRDRICNTFVPRDRALTAAGEGGQTMYFCSERCRDAWRSPT